MPENITILFECLTAAGVAAIVLPLGAFLTARSAVPLSFQPGQSANPFPRLRQSAGFLFLLCLLFAGVFPMTFYPWFDMDFDTYDLVIRKLPLLPRTEPESFRAFLVQNLPLALFALHAIALPFLFETCERLRTFFREDARHQSAPIFKWLLFSGVAFAVVWVINSSEAENRGAGWLLTDCIQGFALLPPAGLIVFLFWRPLSERLISYNPGNILRNQTCLLTLLFAVSLLRLPHFDWAESLWSFLFALPGLVLFHFASLFFVAHPAWQGLIFAALFFAGTLPNPQTRRIAFWLIGIALVVKPLVSLSWG